jgi:hypothetical protein
VNLGSRGRVLVAVSLAAALAFMVAAHGAAHTAPRPVMSWRSRRQASPHRSSMIERAGSSPQPHRAGSTGASAKALQARKPVKCLPRAA